MKLSACRMCRFISMVAFAVGYFALTAISAQESFHVTFGTTDHPHRRFADEAHFVVESSSGDIVVGGFAGMCTSDDGTCMHTNPMVARFSTTGRLLWQRIYTELANHSISALLTQGEEQFIVLQHPRPYGNRDSVLAPITLRHIDANGEISSALGSLEAHRLGRVSPVANGDLAYFAITGNPGTTLRESFRTEMRLYRWDLDGHLTRAEFPEGVRFVQNLQIIDNQRLIFIPYWMSDLRVVQDRATQQTRTAIMWSDVSGEPGTFFTIINKTCRAMTALRDRAYCAESVPARHGEAPPAIGAYSLDGAQIWRHETGVEDPSPLLKALEAGDLLYAIEYPFASLSRLDAEGRLMWRHPIQSAGERAFVRTVAELSDGRLAIVGSTGRFGAYVSTDTDAMLIVTQFTGEGLEDPEIRSHIVKSPSPLRTR